MSAAKFLKFSRGLAWTAGRGSRPPKDLAADVLVQGPQLPESWRSALVRAAGYNRRSCDLDLAERVIEVMAGE